GEGKAGGGSPPKIPTPLPSAPPGLGLAASSAHLPPASHPHAPPAPPRALPSRPNRGDPGEPPWAGLRKERPPGQPSLAKIQAESAERRGGARGNPTPPRPGSVLPPWLPFSTQFRTFPNTSLWRPLSLL
uniref:Uncharacterized protein n=1 Tax=Mustela putorius furo TaxID=9669 RepID=M3YUQ7_MUSPF